MPRVALITDSAHKTLFHDDRGLVPALAAHGIDAVPAIWDDPTTDWDGFALAVVRTPWDYSERCPQFLALIDRLGERVWNPAPVIRWNSDKKYLDDLDARGIRVATTAYAPSGPIDLGPHIQRWGEIVVKPAVGAGGRDTFRVKDDRGPAERAIAKGPGEWMIQPFLSQVATFGELSLVFIDGTYSHAVRKVPAKGAFLVHEEHGGHLRGWTAHPETIAFGEQALAAIGKPVMYARVDIIPSVGGPVLIELELIEPELFLRFDPYATDRLADAIRKRL